MGDYLTIIGLVHREQTDRRGVSVPVTVYFCVRPGNEAANEFGQVADWVKAPRGAYQLDIGDSILPVYDRSGNLATILVDKQ